MSQQDNDSPHAAYTYRYPRPAVTVDCVLFVLQHESLHVLMIQRKHAPYQGMWAFPGGFVNMDEDLQSAAMRELQEETGVADSSRLHVEQLHTFGAVDRDPRQRTISVAYLALAPWDLFDELRVRAADDAADARWWSVYDMPQLAFDHAQILQTARQQLATLADIRAYAFHLLPEEFTLLEFQRAYAALVKEYPDSRRMEQMLVSGLLVDSAHTRSESSGVVKLYRHAPAAYPS